jgi:hypothetical protein
MKLRGIVCALLFSVMNIFGVCNPVVCVFGQSVKMRLQQAVAADLVKVQEILQQNPVAVFGFIVDRFVIDPKHLLQVDVAWLVSKVTLTQFDAEGLDEQTVAKLQKFAEHVCLQDVSGRWIVPIIDNPSFIKARTIVAQYDVQTIHNVSLDELVKQFLV